MYRCSIISSPEKFKAFLLEDIRETNCFPVLAFISNDCELKASKSLMVILRLVLSLGVSCTASSHNPSLSSIEFMSENCFYNVYISTTFRN